MRVFGIDCGTEFTGYGVVEVDCEARMPRLVHLAAGTIRLNKKEKTPQRLAQVYAELTAMMAVHQPDIVAIEEVFFSANAKSALKLGQVRGVAMLAAATSGLPVAEYAPLKIKSSVVGYGLAAKEQVQFMVTRTLQTPPMPWRLRSATFTQRRRWRCREPRGEGASRVFDRVRFYRRRSDEFAVRGFTSPSGFRGELSPGAPWPVSPEVHDCNSRRWNRNL
jgi:crossover junction endodeoxyribonuclease RuvC